MSNLDSSQWPNYHLLVCGYCRNAAFRAHLGHASFADFWEALADFHGVPCDGEHLSNLVLTSVELVNAEDGRWLADHNLLTFSLE